MQGFESISPGVEGLNKNGLEAKEYLGTTEISHFEGCGLISNEQLSGYLREILPPTNLENCPAIEFDPYNSLFAWNPGILGFYEPLSHQIHIGPSERFFNSIEGLLNTVIHEVGHNAYAGLIEKRLELATKWESLYRQSWDHYMKDGTGFVSSYAATNKFEDFAESYMNFIKNPENLKIMSQEKYSFMRDNVFAGLEYRPPILV
jgi:hypothetical protein